MLPVLDAEGYAVCPDCGSRVNCGTIGLANLEKRHRGKKICKAAQEKRDKSKKSKDRTILSFLKPKAAIIPSTAGSQVPVHNYKLVPQSVIDTIPTTSTTPVPPQLEGKSVPSKVLPVSGPIFSNFIKTLRNLVKNLPERHKTVDVTKYKHLWELSHFERSEMKKIWVKRGKVTTRHTKKSKIPPLVISENHRARIPVMYISFLVVLPYDKRSLTNGS